VDNSLKKYKIAFIIPVFEKIDCVEDQVQNIRAVCLNSAIIFHVNSCCSSTYYEQIVFLTKCYDFCFLMEERFPSNWGTGFLVNVYYHAIKWFVTSKTADYLFITHSNSLLINPQLEKKIYEFDFYFNKSFEVTKFSESAANDKNLMLMKSKINIHVTNVDGTAINQKVATELENTLKDYLVTEPLNYHADEYYLSSILESIKDRYKFKDGALERWGHVADGNIELWNLQIKKSADYIVDLMLNNQYDILSKLNIFSLKRVNRDYDDRVRTMIRDHFEYNNEIN